MIIHGLCDILTNNYKTQIRFMLFHGTYLTVYFNNLNYYWCDKIALV